VDWLPELGFFFQTAEQGTRTNTGANHTTISASISPKQNKKPHSVNQSTTKPDLQNKIPQNLRFTLL
jgi:hypothetical protein